MSGTSIGPFLFPFPPQPLVASTAAAQETTRAEQAEAVIQGTITGLQSAITALQATTATLPVGPATLIAPASFTTPASSTLTLVGIVFTDPGTPISSYPMAVSCLHGTLSVAGATGGTLAGSGTNAVTGSGTLAAIQAQLAAVSYTAPATGATDTIAVSVTRGTTLSYGATIAVTVATVTAPATGNNGGFPTFAYPAGPFAATTGTALAVPGFVITDPPAVTAGGAGKLTVSVTGSGSTIAMAPGGVTVAGSVTASITISGTVAAANAALATLMLTGTTAGTATISATYTDVLGFISPIVSASVTVTGTAATAPPAVPVGLADPSMTVPALAITPSGVHTFTNIYWYSSRGATNTGFAEVNLTSGTGLVSVALQGAATISAGANNSKSMQVKGSFADAIATLAKITYTAPSAAGNDTLLVDAYDGFGVESYATINITVSAANAIGLPATITIGQNTSNAVTGVAFASTVAAATPAGPYFLGFFTNSYYGGDISFGAMSGTTSTTGPGVGKGKTGVIIKGTYSQLQAALATLIYKSYTSQPDTLSVQMTDGTNVLLNSNTSTITITAGATYAQGAVPAGAGAATETGGYTGATTTGTTSTGTGTGTTIVTGQTPFRTADFLDNRIAFNVFPGYGTGTDYSNAYGSAPANYQSSMVISILNWLFSGTGFAPRLRFYHNTSFSSQEQAWAQAVHNGTGAHFLIASETPGDIASSLPIVSALATTSLTGGPVIDWVEPINEPNINSWTIAQDIAGQKQINTAIASLNGVSCIMSSIVLTGNPFTVYLTAYVDSSGGSYTATSGSTAYAALSSANNAHCYPGTVPDLDDGSNNKGILGDFTNAYLTVFPSNKPLIYTEYHPTYYNNTANAGSVQFNPLYDVYYYMWALFSFWKNFQSGPIYYFAMMDYGSSGSAGFATGMFGQAGVSQPKLAAYALKALMTLLSDTGATKHSFALTAFPYSISGMAAPINAASPYTGGQSMLLEMSDGRVAIMFGNQQVNPGGVSASAVVTFGNGAVTSVSEYDLTTNAANAMTPLQTVNNTASITSNLNASMRLLVIHR